MELIEVRSKVSQLIEVLCLTLLHTNLISMFERCSVHILVFTHRQERVHFIEGRGLLRLSIFHGPLIRTRLGGHILIIPPVIELSIAFH